MIGKQYQNNRRPTHIVVRTKPVLLHFNVAFCWKVNGKAYFVKLLLAASVKASSDMLFGYADRSGRNVWVKDRNAVDLEVYAPQKVSPLF